MQSDTIVETYNEGKKNEKAIFFDFDCTLTYTHVYWLLTDIHQYSQKWGSTLDNIDMNNLELIILDPDWEKYRNILTYVIFGGDERLAQIRLFLQKIKDNDFDIFITSNGNCVDIVKILKFFDLFHFFKGINASMRLPSPDYNCNELPKHRYIDGFAKTYKEIYYVDDDPTENGKLREVKQLIFERRYLNIPVKIEHIGKTDPNVKRYIYFGKNIGLEKDKNGLTIEMLNQIEKYIFDTEQNLENTIESNQISIQTAGKKNDDDTFEKKYIKYKKKYFELKKLKKF